MREQLFWHTFDGCYCVYQIKAVLLRQILNAMYRDPTCYVSDIEVLTGKSYSTAKRIYSKARKFYSVTNRAKLTIQQVQSYLVKISELNPSKDQ